MNVMSHITLNHRQMDFAIKNSLNFAGSALGQMFACKKDMFYRFLSNEDINRQPKSLAKLKSLITRALLYNIQEARSTVWGMNTARR